MSTGWNFQWKPHRVTERVCLVLSWEKFIPVYTHLVLTNIFENVSWVVHLAVWHRGRRWPLVSPHCSTLVTAAGPQSLIRWSWKGRDFFYDEDDESDVTTCVSTLSTACFNSSEKKFLYTLVAFNTVFMKSWGCLKSCWIMQYRFSAASVGRLWQILWIWKSVSAWRWQENLATSKFTCCCCSEHTTTTGGRTGEREEGTGWHWAPCLGWLSIVVVVIASKPENPPHITTGGRRAGGTKLSSHWLTLYCPAQEDLPLAKRAIVFGT